MKLVLVMLILVNATACSRTSVAPFHELDRNGDGRISQEEATHDVVLSEVFADVDSDENGELTAFEYLQANRL